MPENPRAIHDPARLASVRATGLLDTGADEAFDQLARLACRVLDTPYAFVTLVDDTRSFWKSCIGVDATDPAERQNAVGDSFCQYVVKTDEPLVVGDVTADAMTRDNPSIESMGVRAWAGHPVRDAEGRVLGTMCAVDVRTRDWSADDDDLLRLLAESASNVIQIRQELERTESAASQVRQSLLPPVLEIVPGVDVAALHRSAEGRGSVMGDFYDLFRSDRGHWHVLIGDVCGRGAEAAKFTSLVRWVYQTTADQTDDPAEILTTVNRILRRQHDARFVTGQAVSFAQPTDEELVLTFASAGHHPALILRADGSLEAVEENGWMLGVFDPYESDGVQLRLQVGDMLALFTDGVTEARRGAQQLDIEGLRARLTHFRGDAFELSHRIVEIADDFGDTASDDDIAVVVISPNGQFATDT